MGPPEKRKQIQIHPYKYIYCTIKVPSSFSFNTKDLHREDSSNKETGEEIRVKTRVATKFIDAVYFFI